MNKVITEIRLTPDQVQEAEDSWAGDPDTKDSVVLFRVVGKFPNGFEMDIEIPNCRTEKENYINYVLFDKQGTELGCGIDDVGVIIGDYTIEFEDIEYIVKLS